MLLTLRSASVLILGLCCRTQAKDATQRQNVALKILQQAAHGNGDKAQLGTDVTLSCEGPRLPASSTLQWEREGVPAANTSLLLNNTAYIVLHSVDEGARGTYTCKLRHNGTVRTICNHTLDVSTHSYSGKIVLYRVSSNHSDLSLICKSRPPYNRKLWLFNQPKVVLFAAEKGQEPQVRGPIKPGNRSSTSHEEGELIFHISPVRFNYSGTYTCVRDDKKPYTTIRLCTIRVSAEPLGDAFKDPSVVLTCELSDVVDRVTLAWLRMEGNMAVVVKEVLTVPDSRRTLSVTVSSPTEDELLWQCAVFTEGTLRALAPLWLPPQAGGSTVEGSGLRTVVFVASAVAACVGILLGVLLFFWQRKSAAGEPPVMELKPTAEPLYSAENRDDSHVAMAKPEEEEEELHYASVTVVGFCHGHSGNSRRKAPGSSDSTIYSNIVTKRGA